MTYYLITKSLEDRCDIRFWSFESLERIEAAEYALGGMHPDHEPVVTFEVRDGRVVDAGPADELAAIAELEF